MSTTVALGLVALGLLGCAPPPPGRPLYTPIPESLRDDAESGYEQSKALIERWHGRGRLGYAITPRFALTSSDAQLEAAGKLAAEYPDTWIHTHLAENPAEIEEVARLFPDSTSYLDVYARFGLVRERAVFAHCLHLQQADLTYRQLQDEARYRQACKLLGERGTRISEVAYALGYNDVANFSRAFKRWSGKTPREYREGI